MLETIRAYGREQLAASGEAASVHDRHAAWCVQVAEQGMPAPWANPPLGWMARMSAELGNFRAAFDWLEAQADVALALRLATARTNTRYGMGPSSKGGSGWCGRSRSPATAFLSSVRGRSGRSAVLSGRSNMTWSRLDHSGGRPGPLSRAGRCRGHPQITRRFGREASDLGDVARGQRLLEEALSLSSPDQPPRDIILATLGMIVGLRGDDDRSEVLLKESVALERVWGDPWMAPYIETCLAEIAHRRGDVAQAARMLLDALTSHPDRIGGPIWPVSWRGLRRSPPQLATSSARHGCGRGGGTARAARSPSRSPTSSRLTSGLSPTPAPSWVLLPTPSPGAPDGH